MTIIQVLREIHKDLLYRREEWLPKDGKYLLVYPIEGLLHQDKTFPTGIVECRMIDGDVGLSLVDLSGVIPTNPVLEEIVLHHIASKTELKERVIWHGGQKDRLMSEIDELCPSSISSSAVIDFRPESISAGVTILQIYGQIYHIIPVDAPISMNLATAVTKVQQGKLTATEALIHLIKAGVIITDLVYELLFREEIKRP
jgi:hypothetical protein